MEELKKSIIWTDPKIHFTYLKGILGLCIFSTLFSLISSSKLLMNYQTVISFVSLTGFMLAISWLFSKASQLKANSSVKKLSKMINDPNIKPTKVQVLSQSKLGLLHSKIFNGPGVRRAIDSKGKKYWVPYRGKLEVEFEANMYLSLIHI